MRQLSEKAFDWRKMLFLSIGLFGFTLALPLAADAAETQVVAVADFENNTGDKAHNDLGRGIAHMLITDLSVLPSIKIVERSQLNKILAELLQLDEENLLKTDEI